MFLLSLLLLLSLSLTSSQTCPPMRQIQLTNSGMKEMIVQGDVLYVRFASVVEQYSLTNRSLLSTWSTTVLGRNPVKMLVDLNQIIYSFNRSHVTRISSTGTILSSQLVNVTMRDPTQPVYVMDAAVSPSNIIHVLSNHGRGSSLMTLPFNDARNISRQDIQLFSLYNMFIGWNGTVYVQDNTPAQIQIISYTPYPQLQSGRHLAPVMFLTNSFVVDRLARTYVIDMSTPRITAYTEDDIFINHIRPQSLVSPYQLALTSNGDLLIADNSTNIIHFVSDVDCYLSPAASSSTGAACPDIELFEPNPQKGQLLNSWSFSDQYWPTSIDIDDNGLLYSTANLQRHVWIASLEGNGTVLETITRVGNNSLTPATWSAKLDGSGNWWILDYGGRSLHKWNLETSDVETWSVFWWYYISAVAMLPDGSRWSIKAYTYRALYQFDQEGTYICTMNGPHTYWGGAVYDEQGYLWVADQDTLYRFAPNCSLVAQIGGFHRFSEIGFDSSGLLYLAHRNITRNNEGSVLVFDPLTMSVIDEFGSFYTDNITPTALALDNDNNVYVSEGASILKFSKRYSTTVQPPTSCPSTSVPTSQPTSSPTSSPTSQPTSQPNPSSSTNPTSPTSSSTAQEPNPTSDFTLPPDSLSSSTGVWEEPGPGGANSATSRPYHLLSPLSLALVAVFLMF